MANSLQRIRGIKNVGVFHVMGQSNLALPIDRDKCANWNVSVQAVQNVVQTAVGGLAFTQMIEGERTFDITLRWPERLRNNERRYPQHSRRRRQQRRRPPMPCPRCRTTVLTGASTGPRLDRQQQCRCPR